MNHRGECKLGFQAVIEGDITRIREQCDLNLMNSSSKISFFSDSLFAECLISKCQGCQVSRFSNVWFRNVPGPGKMLTPNVVRCSESGKLLSGESIEDRSRQRIDGAL